MPLTPCPFCEHGNPVDSKFCSECGGALHLVPCPHCGAVSQVTATVCYQCGGRLPERSTGGGQLPEPRPEALLPSSSAAEVPASLPRRPSRVVVGTAVLATIVVLGYYAYRQGSLSGAPRPPIASKEASGRGISPGVGVTGPNATASETKSAEADDSPGLTSPVISPSKAQPTAPGRAVTLPASSHEAKAAGAAAARAITSGKTGEPGLPQSEACTEAAAALGLCTTASAQKMEPETATVEAAIKRPQAGGAGAQEPPRPETCTEGVAALGLCTPKPTQRRE